MVLLALWLELVFDTFLVAFLISQNVEKVLFMLIKTKKKEFILAHFVTMHFVG